MILVTTHDQADFDCAGGALAASLLHPGAVISFPGAKMPAVHAYLTAHPGLLLEQRARDVDLATVRTLIVVDTQGGDRLGRFAALLARPDVDLVVYDHHPREEQGRGTVHVEEVGAVTSLLTLRLKAASRPPTPAQATLMLLGIHEDTGGLLYVGTRAEDFEAAAWLVRCGGDLSQVAEVRARGLTPEQVDLHHALLHDAQPLAVGTRDVLVATAECTRFVPEAARIVQDLGDILSARRLVALIRMEDRVILIARSRARDFDAARLAARFGGGGHAVAASAVLRGRTLAEARAEVVAALQGTLPPQRTAGELMTTPLFTLPAQTLLAEGVATLNRYRLNVLPVVRRGRVVGALTRQVADVALGHGLGERAVADVAAAEVPIVPPDAGLEEVRRRLLSGGHRFVLVGEGPARVQGIITRAELLRALHSAAADDPAEEGAEGEDLAGVLAERLPPDTVALLRRVGVLAQQARMHAYLVGGVVRDVLLGREVGDLDLVVEGDGAALAALLAREIGGRARTHPAFGTAVLEAPGERRIDLATARTEHYPKPGALPRVIPGGLRQDLFRRDFTINAMAVALDPERFGVLLDPFGGRSDLKLGRIRVLHGLSFLEDPTRAFRAVRFAARLDFALADETEHLLRVARREDAFSALSSARLGREMERLLSERRLVRAGRLLARLRLLEVLHPDLRLTAKGKARLERTEEVLAWARLQPEAPEARGWLVALAVLLDPLGPAARQGMLQRTVVRAGDRGLLLEAQARAARVLARLPRRWAGDAALHAACAEETPEVLLLAMVLAPREETRARLARGLTVLRNVRPDVTGRDLLRQGVPQGPGIAAGLRAALRAKLQGAEGKEAQLAAAVRAARGRAP